MAINIYLFFNGNCRQAVEFYASVFDTEKPNIMTFGDSPRHPDFPLPEEAKDLVMHAELTIDGSNVMFSDFFPGLPFNAGNNIGLAIVNKDMSKIKSWFTKLQEDGTVTMELQETFWSKCYGKITDKFGIEWQLSYDNQDTGM